MWDFGQFENDFWDASWHLFAGLPILTYDIYIYIELEKKNKKKTSKKKFDVSTRDRRRAQWDFWGVLDESLFFV